MLKRIISTGILITCIINTCAFAAPELNINARSAILMEQSTGQILYEQNPDEQLPIASVTKIMTLLLICEAIDEGKITIDDNVTVSERAMSMGGSTMFLETGDVISVDEMLKGIVVASANDGAVAMAEYISGSEDEFVSQMNQRAKDLGMENTHFVNTNGLDADGHYSSARDVAIMSRELMTHPLILNYTKIWTDTMRGGKFELANTNKLIRFYEGATGLKTGSTSKALCCLSATAERNGMGLVAVVLGAPDSKARFNGARALLDWGFAAYNVKEIIPANQEIGKIKIKGGTQKEVGLELRVPETILTDKADKSEYTYEIVSLPDIKAPIYKGDCVGEGIVYKDKNEIKRTKVYANSDIPKKTFLFSAKEIINVLTS